MPSNINIDNKCPAAIDVKTNVVPFLSDDDWGVSANAAPTGQTTRILWMNRSEGITDGKTWEFTTSFTLDGVEVLLQESLTGTTFDSDLQVQIQAGSQSTGWQTEDTSLTFQGKDKSYKVKAHWFLNGIHDDVTYTVEPAGIMPKINHVVVLMMENRSLDNLLGWVYTSVDNRPPHNIPAQSPTSYDGLTAETFSNETPSLGKVFASEGTTSWPPGNPPTVVPKPDPGESFDQMTQQIFNGESTENMAGFLANYEEIAGATAKQIMQSYSPSQVPVLSKLATSFAVSDAWFASCPCQTWPNRGFVHTGSSDGHINNDDAEPYDIETIFNLLDDQNVTWKVYNDTVLPSLVHIMFPKLWLKTSEFQSMTPFYEACQASADAPAEDKLPTYSFLEPNFLDPDESYHPPHDISPAEAFLQRVYSHLQACPYRDEILFVVTFDEHGGCYDHVNPPTGAAAPEPGSVSRNGEFHFDRFGVRVPTIVISSYVTPGTVFRSGTGVPFDHTSILATLRDWIPIDEANFEQTLPSPRITGAPTLGTVLTETYPQPWPEISPPAVPETAAAERRDTPLDDLQVSIVLGEANLRAGKFIGKDAAAALRERIRTQGDAIDFFAEIPSRKKR